MPKPTRYTPSRIPARSAGELPDTRATNSLPFSSISRVENDSPIPICAPVADSIIAEYSSGER